MKYQSLFSGKNNKKFIKLSSSESAYSVLSVVGLFLCIKLPFLKSIHIKIFLLFFFF